MSALQQLWNGISPCMEPGVGGCAVWWDAWAVIVASVGLAVAMLNVVVAAGAAIAVFFLGKSANEVARVGLINGVNDRQRLNDEAAAEREREEKVLLCYLAGELAQTRITLRAMERMLDQPSHTVTRFVEDPEIRRALADSISAVSTEKISSVISRLHAVKAGTGMRLARLAGDIASLNRTFSSYASPRWAGTPRDDDELVRLRLDTLRSGFVNAKAIIKRAASDAVVLDMRSVEVATMLEMD